MLQLNLKFEIGLQCFVLQKRCLQINAERGVHQFFANGPCFFLNLFALNRDAGWLQEAKEGFMIEELTKTKVMYAEKTKDGL